LSKIRIPEFRAGESFMILIYNPSCSKSRAIRSELAERGYAPRERNYLETPLNLAELHALQMELNCDAIEFIRQKEDAFEQAGLSPDDPDNKLLEAVEKHPVLLQRPIVIWNERGIIARPPEKAFEFLPDRRFEFRETTFDVLEDLVHDMLLAPIDLEPAIAKREWRTAEIMLGCFDRDSDECVGSALFFDQSFNGDESAWRLRAMAVKSELQGLGLGRNLLRDGADAVKEADHNATMLWCNAREPAVPFYRSCGWEVVSEQFDIEGVGPHYAMTLEL
jgi:arsenate reductase